MGARDYTVDFPTLWVVPEWHERHCIIPDGWRKGTAWRHYDWQLWVTVNHYRVRDDADPFDADGYPTRAAAFTYRRSQVTAPQKTGKGPLAAVLVAGEALGPVVFVGWAEGGEQYRCEDHGCSCGWVYIYESGEPMGEPWASPLIQLMATSEDQVDNVYRPLQSIARGPLLSEQMLVREGFIRLPGDGRIDVVTAKAQSRLGQPITFALMDETQLYTDQNKLTKVAETMRRGLGGMGGRAMETTNCWDPAEKSTAQRTHESKSRDLFRFYEPPDPKLRYGVKSERRQIHKYNYQGSPHVNLDTIEAEAAEILETDPAQAERFYGNRIVAGMGGWMDREAWQSRTEPQEVPAGTQLVAGFDGSDVDDWTGIRAETREGYQFTPRDAQGNLMVWDPAQHGGQVPRLEVSAAVEHLFATFDVVRMYVDPPYWESELDAWAERHGESRVLGWRTQRMQQMHAAAERFLVDVQKADSEFTHDGCEITTAHVLNTRRSARSGGRYVLAKPGDGRKIDLAVSSVLCHEAAGDVTAKRQWRDTDSRVFFLR